MRALDGLLGIDDGSDEEHTEGVQRHAPTNGQKEDEEEDMPLTCDVCGKTPDVEVSSGTQARLGRP